MGLAQKEEDLGALQSRVNFLRNNRDPEEAAAEIAEKEAAIIVAQEDLAALAGVREELDSKEIILRNARKSLSQLEGQLAAATDPASVNVAAVTTVDPSVAVIRAAVTGAILGFGIAVVIVAGVALVRARPSAAGEETPDEIPSAAADTADSAPQPNPSPKSSSRGEPKGETDAHRETNGLPSV